MMKKPNYSNITIKWKWFKIKKIGKNAVLNRLSIINQLIILICHLLVKAAEKERIQILPLEVIAAIRKTMSQNILLIFNPP
jgi:hypothetical protein